VLREEAGQRVDQEIAVRRPSKEAIRAAVSLRFMAEETRNAARRALEEAQRLSPQPGPQVWDPNMQMAHALGRALCPDAELPPSLRPPGRRAAMVEAADGPIVSDFGSSWSDVAAALGRGVFLHGHGTGPFMPDVECSLRRAAISLIVWAGCVSAAKTIAWRTAAGRNTPERRQGPLDAIARECLDDPLYAAGVEVAVLWKRGRRQKIYLNDVPADHPIRALANRGIRAASPDPSEGQRP